MSRFPRLFLSLILLVAALPMRAQQRPGPPATPAPRQPRAPINFETYDPVSMLVVPGAPVTRARFPFACLGLIRLGDHHRHFLWRQVGHIRDKHKHLFLGKVQIHSSLFKQALRVGDKRCICNRVSGSGLAFCLPRPSEDSAYPRTARVGRLAMRNRTHVAFQLHHFTVKGGHVVPTLQY